MRAEVIIDDNHISQFISSASLSYTPYMIFTDATSPPLFKSPDSRLSREGAGQQLARRKAISPPPANSVRSGSMRLALARHYHQLINTPKDDDIICAFSSGAIASPARCRPLLGQQAVPLTQRAQRTARAVKMPLAAFLT